MCFRYLVFAEESVCVYECVFVSVECPWLSVVSVCGCVCVCECCCLCL